MNLFFMTFCFTGITTLISACSSDRWRVMAIATGIFVVSSIIEMISRMWADGAWMRYLTFLAAFEPQRLVIFAEKAEPSALQCNLTLLSLGLICYGVAAAVLWYRDIPAPR